MTTVGAPATGTDSMRSRLDRPVLVGNLVSGALWLAPVAFLSPLLFLIGAAYVAAAGVFLAAVYGRRGIPSRKHEALAWATPWLLATALWAGILGGISFENTVSHYVVSLGSGVLIATPCYLAWQIVALAVRQLMAWRSGRTSLPM